ncbi:hypothetical protein AMTRI_Chr03g48410 [Amborella trichopoda]
MAFPSRDGEKWRGISPDLMGSDFCESVDLEVVGRHAFLFDDDSTSQFVDSSDALVPWNGDSHLSIDRYDVRHLLSDLSSLRKKQKLPSSKSPDAVSESDLDFERFRDLRKSDDPEGGGRGAEMASGSYQAVPFSYGNTEASSDPRNSEERFGKSNFCPPFPMPETLVNHLFKLSKRSNTAQPLDVDKKSVRETSRFKGANSAQGLNGSSAQVPTDLDRTEKFRMVIGGAKKESQDPPSKPSQQGVGLSVEAAAEIVLAATRGSRNNNPKTNFSKTHLDSSKATEDPGLSNSETGGSLPLSLHACGHSTSERDKSNSLPPLVSNLEKGGVSVAKAMAESAALAAASEADSSEARLSHDQKLKAERLKRAKMFAALIKAGGAHRAPVQLTLGQPILASASGHSDTLEIRSRSRGATPSFSGANALEPSKMDLGLLEETQEIESFEERKKETVQTGHEGRNDKSKKEVEENGGDSKKHRNYRRKHHEEEKNDESEEEQGEDRASKKHKRSKKKRHGRGRKGESEEEEGEVRDDKKHTHSRKEWHRRERNDQSEEEEEEVGNNKKHKHSKEKQHAGERSDGTEEEEEGEVRESKKHRHSRRKRHRREINYESGEEDEDDGDTKQDRHSKRKCHREDKRRHDAEIDEKRHKSHSTSKRTESRYRHKHHDSSEGSDGHGRKSDKHKERYRRDDDGVNLEPTVYRSGDEVEVGEKVDSMSLGGVEGGRGEAPHSEIPEDLRTKIRAMLLSTL